MKIKKYKKIYALIAMASLLVIGTSFAMIYQEIQHKNVLTADTIKAEISEVFAQGSKAEGTVPKTVNFKNSGSTDVFVRVAYVESWTGQDEKEGDILLNNKINGIDVATKNWTAGFKSDWIDGGDGWFYYKKILETGDSTGEILSSVTFPQCTQHGFEEYSGSGYSLYFKVEMIQASTGSSTLNKSEVNTDSTSMVFGKTATVGADGAVTWR